MRISFQILLANALLVSQLASASSGDDTQLRTALMRAMKTHDTVMVQAVANSGHESIDNDIELQEQIKSYFANEAAYEKARNKRAKAAAQAKSRAKVQKPAKSKALIQEKKEPEVQERMAAPVVEQISLERDDDTAQKEAEAQRAEQERQKLQKATEAKLAQEAQAKKDATKLKAQKQAQLEKEAAQKKRTERLAKEEAQRNAALKEKNRKIAAAKKARAKKAHDTRIAKEQRIAKQKKAASQKPLSVSSKKLLGTWKEVNSEKVITLKIAKDAQFTLEQVEEDGTLLIAGTWKSEENIFMMNIKKVQRNMHTRETDIHRVYKVVTLNKKQLVLHDKRNRVAYDLSR